jgi:aspartate kinase
MKFGGTSVEDGAAFERAANIVHNQRHSSPVIVVSAMAGMTDALVKSIRLAARGEVDACRKFLEEYFERHGQVASRMGSRSRKRMYELIDEAREDIQRLLTLTTLSSRSTAKHQDALISQGERLSAQLMAMELAEHGLPAVYIDARICIMTNASHGNAQPLLRTTSQRTQASLKPLLATKQIPVLGGFMGATRNGVTTTLGRGSSDYTATLIGAALNAREVQIWTDVNGVQTADPSLVRSARTVSQLTYSEAAELARLGARVMHPKMIQPLLEKKIPIRICNSRAPERSGTLVCATRKASRQAVKAIAHQPNLARIDIASTPTSLANGFLHSVEKVFNRHQHEMQIVAISVSKTSFACLEAEPLSPLILDLKEIGHVRIKTQRATISCVGEDLLRAPGSAQRVLDIAGNIDRAMTWRSTSSLNLMSMVNADSVAAIVGRLHEEIFEGGGPQKTGDV